MKPKVYVTRQVPQAGMDMLRSECEWEQTYSTSDQAQPTERLLGSRKTRVWQERDFNQRV